MDQNKLEAVLHKLQEAKCPEDVFGSMPGASSAEQANLVKDAFRMLAKIVHPDGCRDAKLRIKAEEAFKLLKEMEGKAKAKIDQGLYGQRKTPVRENEKKPVTFKTRRYVYTIAELLHSGQTCGVFRGLAQSTSGVIPVIVRVPHAAGDNDLMEREVKAFELMKKKALSVAGDVDAEKFVANFSERLPPFMESLKLAFPGSAEKKVVNIFGKTKDLETGWFNLEEIHKRYPHGVNSRIMAFIWNRVLEGLTYAHLSGVLHRHLTPQHIMIQTEKHFGNICDWTASCQIGVVDPLPYLDEQYKSYFPPELIEPTGRAIPSSDIFMSAWCMVYLLGGDPRTKTIPESVEQPIRNFLNKCLQPSRRARPSSAENAYKEFSAICKSVFGPKKFVKLEMKVT